MAAPPQFRSVLDVIPWVLEVDGCVPEGMRTVLILDAGAGGGKTSAAVGLVEGLVPIIGRGRVEILESDNCYSGEMTARCLAGHSLPEDPSWAGDYYFETFAQLLRRARAGEPVRTIKRDWATGEETGELDLDGVRIVIATGCGIISPAFDGLYDLAGWVHCPRPEAERRGRARSLATGHPEHLVPGADGRDSWHIWMDADDRHRKEHQPHLRADFVVDNTRVAAPVPVY